MDLAGVYSNKQILEGIDSGHIVCRPFNKKNVSGSSLDVTLGEWYYQTETDVVDGVYNPFDEGAVRGYFGKPLRAKVHSEWAKEAGRRLTENIPKNHPIIVIKPLRRILAHTHEFVGIYPPGTSAMKARSTWGRNGVAVCLDAGWGDPGYVNRWTLEIYNLNRYHSVVLPVGERIAQIIFHSTGPVTGSYTKISGKYQSPDGLEQIIDSWCPDMMLPRAFKDKRRLPEEP